MLLRLDKLIEATDRRGAVFDVEIVCVCSAGSTTLESLSGQQHSARADHAPTLQAVVQWVVVVRALPARLG